MNGFKDKIIFSSSVLSTNGVVSFLNATYSVGEICCCELMHSNINDTFKIKTTLGTFACKVYGKLFTYKEIYNKIKDCEEIGKLGIKIAHNIKNISGKSLSLIDCPEGIRFIEITSWADGREFNYSNIKDAYIYGKSLAKLHIETVDKKIFKRRLNLYDRFIDMKNVILEFIKCDRCLYDTFEEIINYEMKYITMLLNSCCRMSFCHGDAHGGNAHLKDNTAIFFDFDYSGFGFSVYDVASFLWLCLQRRNKKLWDAFVFGYTGICNMLDEEKYFCKHLSVYRELWILYLYILNKEKTGVSILGKYFIENQIRFIKRTIKLKEI